MNKFKSVIVLAAVLFASAISVSCSSDDDNPKDPSIVGTWLQTSGSSETIKNGTSEGVENDVVDADNFVRITFNSDGTFSDFSSNLYNGQLETSTDPGTYTTEGNILSFTYDGDPDIEMVTYSVTATQLIISGSDEETNNGDIFVYNYSTTFTRQ